MIRLANSREIENWDKLVSHNLDNGHIYQSKEWGDFKAKFGWEPIRLIFEDKIAVQLLKKSVFGFGNIYYCPKGPNLFKNYKKNTDLFKKFTKQIKDFVKKNDPMAILIKIEPELLDSELNLNKFGYKKAKADLQFKATIFVDLKKDEDEIIASFKQKTRYNINLARRKGVIVRKLKMNAKNINLMYGLMSETQKRAGFFLRRKSYFANYWQMLDKMNMGQMFVAKYNNQVLAAVYATIFFKKAYYKDGGSFSLYRNLMAPYLLQWEAIRWARSHGANSYDLVAVPPKSQIENKDHPQSGLYQFKRGFNEDVTEFVGCWDLILKPKSKWHKIEPYYNKLYAKIYRNLFY